MSTEENTSITKSEEDPRQAARKVLNQHFYGVLATQSQKFPGYPFGSVVPFCSDYQGNPLMLISRLAQHTQNLQQCDKVSLVILGRTQGNVQTDARLTLVAQAVKVAGDEVDDCAARYYRHFPAAQGYHTELDFEFYRFAVQTMRFIPGFGQARWLSAGEVLQANPFSRAEEERIVNHMNEDHQDALLHYHQSAPMNESYVGSINPESIAMVAIDGEGLALRVNDDLERIQYPRTVTNPGEARQVLVEMATS